MNKDLKRKKNLMKPKIVMKNLFSDLEMLRQFALENGFEGIDWSFEIDELPLKPANESKWVERLSVLYPLEVRYHCPFMKVDIGHEDPGKVKKAMNIFRRLIRLISKADGKYLTIHVGLGHDTTRSLSWNNTMHNLREIVQFGADYGVKICLENLAWGWTSKPNLFEKLVRRTGAGVTFDIGHAHACESVESHYFDSGDFVLPHAERVFNAHIYHTEISGVGHLPPKKLEEIANRLNILLSVGCNWWVIEISKVEELLQTKQMIDVYLEMQKHENNHHSIGRIG